MQVLTDAQWAKFEAAITAVKLRKARPCNEDRRTIGAIIWRLDNGTKWRSIQAELGGWHHAYLRFRRWAASGVWTRSWPTSSPSPSRSWHSPALTAPFHRRTRRHPARGQQTDTLKLRFNRKKGSNEQAIGRSRGGLRCKIVGICDAYGGLVDFVLVPGQAHELAPSLQLLGRPPKAPAWALADIACDAAAFRSATEAMGATPVVPSRKNAKEKKPCPGFVYRHRNQIERCWSRLKEWRAVATRYDKTATSYAARITIASTLDWFKPSR